MAARRDVRRLDRGQLSVRLKRRGDGLAADNRATTLIEDPAQDVEVTLGHGEDHDVHRDGKGGIAGGVVGRRDARICPYEITRAALEDHDSACGATFLSRYIAHSAQLLTLGMPRGTKADARDINSVPLGDGIVLRVGRYGPYLEAPGEGDEPRVDLKKPLDSLLLRKPTLAVDHEASPRLQQDRLAGEHRRPLCARVRE